MKNEALAAALGPTQVSLLIQKVSLLFNEVSDDLLSLSEVPHNFGDRGPPPLKLRLFTRLVEMMRQVFLEFFKCRSFIIDPIIDSEPYLVFIDSPFFFNDGQSIFLKDLSRDGFGFSTPPGEVRKLIDPRGGVLTLTALIHDVLIVFISIIFVIADGTDSAGPKLHDVGCECARFVCEDVLDLSHLLMKGHVHGLALLVGRLIIHAYVIAHKGGLRKLDELYRDD
jgi:hypothetical protein